MLLLYFCCCMVVVIFQLLYSCCFIVVAVLLLCFYYIVVIVLCFLQFHHDVMDKPQNNSNCKGGKDFFFKKWGPKYELHNNVITIRNTCRMFHLATNIRRTKKSGKPIGRVSIGRGGLGGIYFFKLGPNYKFHNAMTLRNACSKFH